MLQKYIRILQEAGRLQKIHGSIFFVKMAFCLKVLNCHMLMFQLRKKYTVKPLCHTLMAQPNPVLLTEVPELENHTLAARGKQCTKDAMVVYLRLHSRDSQDVKQYF